MVTNLDEIKIIREIFSKYPLNTTKYLNFLALANGNNIYKTNISI